MKKLIVVAMWTMCGALQAADWTVYLRRVGPLRIGMSLDQARKAIEDAKATLETPGDDPAECGYLKSKKLPEGLGLMFVQGKLARFDIGKGSIHTASGAGVGDTEQRIKELYAGRIRVDPHHYTGPEGHYLRYLPSDAADRGYELLFETDGQKVLEFRAGTKEAVAFVEGCL